VRYRKVLHQCALEPDLALFETGDQTEVGEKGLTLSGGQKARITLARAIYSRAEIILLDDVLAALDVHTSSWIVRKCLNGDLVKDRTVIMVVCICRFRMLPAFLLMPSKTHNVALTVPLADFMVSLRDGQVLEQGVVKEVLEHDPVVSAELREEREALKRVDEEVDLRLGAMEQPAPQSDGKLIVAEEVALGHVGWAPSQWLVLSQSCRNLSFVQLNDFCLLREAIIPFYLC
jgi:ABC-type glutathione transport system ATPase component